MARIKGFSKTEEFIPSTRIISYTNNPVGTIFAVWHGSRNERSVDPKVINDLYTLKGSISGIHHEMCEYLVKTYPEYCKGEKDDWYNVIVQVVKLAIKCDVPASEFVSFEFETDNAPVAWREQLVRNRKLRV